MIAVLGGRFPSALPDANAITLGVMLWRSFFQIQSLHDEPQFVNLTMKNLRRQELDFEIDRLTNSIQNTVSGDSFDTTVSPLTIAEQKVVKKSEWIFDWRKELKDKAKSVCKLTIKDNPAIIQGLISIEDRGDHIFMHLIESARFNKGKLKIYYGVPGNLVAFACSLSKEKGYDGVVSFFSKTRLIDHYKESLGAKVLFGNQMIIDEAAADKLILKYFKQ